MTRQTPDLDSELTQLELVTVVDEAIETVHEIAFLVTVNGGEGLLYLLNLAPNVDRHRPRQKLKLKALGRLHGNRPDVHAHSLQRKSTCGMIGMNMGFHDSYNLILGLQRKRR